MNYVGQCLCGAIAYQLTGSPISVALCHCKDCRRLDDPEALAPGIQIQVAERLQWMKHVHELPEFERFPG